MSSLKVEFFHDVVCGWCFVLAPRLKQLQAELDLDIQHRSFILQTSREAMIERFGSMPQAKDTILGHWQACARAEDEKRINIEGMRQQPFEYPNGLLAARACQTANALGGNAAHEQMFDRLQLAHLVQSRNIGDKATVLAIAAEAGFDPQAFEHAFEHDAPALLEQDLRLGRHLGISSVPSLVIADRYLIPGALGLEQLRQSLNNIRQELAAKPEGAVQ
ncbi:DsbA family protein [Pseudomonas wadenswilerensis]|jgi:predicted DsbA family dithiol-disulfide isomerase|uniref:DSBA-like thioredoxin domain protein n=1 Tax=Pseudomonas wadenswilerensis TaxID=1785161 RepID=A0A380T2J2_9PSED|nr:MULTISPECIES: DsbA family protein [Pseudomonas]MCE5982524.1 DsbA family protein [Pseudomonas sp. LF19]UVM23483.1 DsbA family protein [Pseudomonas wadenswilerensis]SPO67747.1 DSBA oxidoreductase [Pseudomonas sp. JV241A]SUQ64457.1 DSBA-like thioredoxin domain protein [Pseudomonas wadenswilerensis]